MNITVLSKTGTEVEVEIGGEGHTFLNVLKDALLDVEGVEAASYDMNPEQSGGNTEPILYVKTDDSVDPLDAVSEATDGIKDEVSEFKDALA
ncbi:RpoL/Rpb11 RNA polymerase subunit family protein [Halorutilales archaeon Cl-col2-1]